MASTLTRLRLFILEAPSPMDLLQNRAEAPALERACALIGHEVSSFIANSKIELRRLCEFIASIDSDQDQSGRSRVPLCVHIAGHGNASGIGVGAVTLPWDDLLEILQPLCRMRDYDGDVILVISACGAADQELTDHFAAKVRQDRKFKPPAYVFVTADDAPTFPGTLVSWIVFYHQLPRASLRKKDEIQAVLARVKAAGAATLMYYRWDTGRRCYLRHKPKASSLADA
jgi:hypothetical protein